MEPVADLCTEKDGSFSFAKVPYGKWIVREIEQPKEMCIRDRVKIEPLFEEMVDFDTFSKSDFRAVKVKDRKSVV